MIPGLKAIPAFNGSGSSGSGGGGATLSMSLVGYSSVNSTNVTIPAAAIAGDWAILFDADEDTGGGAIGSAVPAGWASIADTFASPGWALRSTVSHKILTAAGGGSVTGIPGGTKILMVFRPSTSLAAATPSTWNAEVTAGNPSAQTVSASGVTTPLIVFAWASLGNAGDALPSFSTETPAMTNLTNTGPSGGPECRLGYTIYNTSPSDQSIDTADGGSINGLQSGYVRFT